MLLEETGVHSWNTSFGSGRDGCGCGAAPVVGVSPTMSVSATSEKERNTASRNSSKSWQMDWYTSRTSAASTLQSAKQHEAVRARVWQLLDIRVPRATAHITPSACGSNKCEILRPCGNQNNAALLQPQWCTIETLCTLLEQCRSTGQCRSLQQQGMQVCDRGEWPSILEAAGGFVSFTQ